MITFVALWALYGFAVLRLGPRWKFVRYLPMAIGGLIVSAPFWSLAVILLMPSSCRQGGGGPDPCLLLGVNFGDLLYLLGNLVAWGMFLMPILAIGGAIYVAVHLPFFFVALRRDKAARPPEPRPRQVALAATIVIAILLAHAWYEAATAPTPAELREEAAQRERDTNWRMAVGTCPARVKRAGTSSNLSNLG